MISGEHSSRQYDLELESIRSQVLQMGGLVETHFLDAVACLRNTSPVQVEQVMLADAAVNQLELKLDKACMNLIVKRQPTANDLRSVIATIKVITDLERIGDEVTRVARSAKNLLAFDTSGINSYEILRSIAAATNQMLHDALDAYARMDGQQSRELIERDKKIDSEYRAVMGNLVTLMMEDRSTIAASLETMWAVKSIERIGDHAKNIAEYVVFVVEGKDIRHMKSLEALQIDV
jgi:phosphate transport system protein